MFTLNRTNKTMILLLGFVALAAIAASQAVALSITQSRHNFAVGGISGFAGGFETLDEFGLPGPITDVCVFCHTPHNAAIGAAAPLWNRTTVAPATAGYTYQMYSVATMSAKDVPISGPTGVSALCMSCHDGVTAIAVGTLLNPPGDAPVTPGAGAYQKINDLYTGSGWPSDWGANLGNIDPATANTVIDLSNDHPVSFTYPTNAPGIKSMSGIDSRLRLFGAGKDKVECSTCHLVHDNAIEPFLAMPNAGSAMCLSCHDK